MSIKRHFNTRNMQMDSVRVKIYYWLVPLSISFVFSFSGYASREAPPPPPIEIELSSRDAKCNGFEIVPPEGKRIFSLYYPIQIKENQEIEYIGVSYLEHGSEILKNSFKVNSSEEPFIMLAFMEGIDSIYDMSVDFTYECLNCKNSQPYLYRIPSFSKYLKDYPLESCE